MAENNLLVYKDVNNGDYIENATLTNNNGMYVNHHF